MSFERNKKDFEECLDKMEDELGNLDGIIVDDLLDIFQSVITEYNDHLKSDVEDAIDEIEKLDEELADSQNEISNLSDEIEDLKFENETLSRIISELENKINS